VILNYRAKFITYPGSLGNDITYARTMPLTDISSTGAINNGAAGWYSAGPYSATSYFFNAT
jgi:hypothetical protein